MHICSATDVYAQPPPGHASLSLTAHYFPANPGNGTLLLIDWASCGDQFQPGDSIHLLFTGDLKGEQATDHWDYWWAIFHFSEHAKIALLSVITQVNPLNDYSDSEWKRVAGLRQLAGYLHQDLDASATRVIVQEDQREAVWFEFQGGSTKLIPGMHALPENVSR